jgi:hypothetical protein
VEGSGIVTSDRSRRLRELFPTPLVGIVALLVALILLTPNLLTNGSPPAGSILAQAELIVDRAPQNKVPLNFYVRGLSLVRYAMINVSLATNYNWSASTPVADLQWTNWTNESFTLILAVSTFANPVVLNLTVTYTSSGYEVFAGLIAFWVSGSSLLARSLSSEVAAPGSTALSALPLTLLLGIVTVV